MTGPASGCPSEDELVRLVEGALDDASLAGIEAHVDGCERCAAVLAGLGALGSAGAAGPAGPRVVGRYQLDRRIAAGGMGEVWAAWDPQLRREIAVKLVRPDRADDGRERERLLREARALARLGHPNVLAVHDVGEVDGEVFIATELVAGETLASRGGPSASWRELVRLYTQATRGLAAAHAAGLVHRDVKPSNLLLGLDGRVRVADFGLAVRSPTPTASAPTARAGERPGEEPLAITAPGFISGTPAYMAPEQRAGQPPDARADQYALCVSIVESLDGRRPPPDLDRDGLVAFLGARRPREPGLDALCGVIVRGLAVDPTRRFPDMNALADAMERTVGAAPADSASAEPADAGPADAGSTRELAAAATIAPGDLQPTAPLRPAGSAVRAGSGAMAAGSAGAMAAGSAAHPQATGSMAGAATEAAPLPSSAQPPAADVRRAHAPSSGSSGPYAASPASPASGPYAAAPASGSHTPGAGASSRATASSDTSARRVTPARPAARRRRVAPIAIAALAAAAGVIAVLVVARVVLKKSRPAPDTAGSAAPAPAPPGPTVEPITPGSGAPPPPQPAPPGGSPVAIPRAPGKTVAIAPPAAGPPVDLSTFMTEMQKHLRNHDGRACRQLVAGLPPSIPPTARFGIESFVGYCEMIAGDCAGGTARVTRALSAQGIPSSPSMYVEQYCPIEGDLETRVARLRMQASAHAADPAWCNALIPPARQAAGEVSTGPHRGVLGFVLLQLAKCVGSAGRCDDARGLWSQAAGIDPTVKSRAPDLGAACASAAAALQATAAYADPTAILQGLNAALRTHDIPACQRLIAAAPTNVAPGHQHSLELLRAQCEMMSGDCAAGTARLRPLEPNGPGGSPVSQKIKDLWVQSKIGTYCPITGDLNARVNHLWSQVDSFASSAGGGLIAWCDHLVGPAKTIAGEITTAAHRHRVALSLRRLGSCMGYAGRCAEGRDLMTLSEQLDPTLTKVPDLGEKCP